MVCGPGQECRSLDPPLGNHTEGLVTGRLSHSGMFGFLVQGDSRGLEHSRGNKCKMRREAKTCSHQAHSAWVSVAGSFPRMVAAQVKGHQQETLTPQASGLRCSE